jgi:hypothetical protein
MIRENASRRGDTLGKYMTLGVSWTTTLEKVRQVEVKMDALGRSVQVYAMLCTFMAYQLPSGKENLKFPLSQPIRQMDCNLK